MNRTKKTKSELVNSNEIITDYDFYVQLFLEEKALDFEKQGIEETLMVKSNPA